MASKQAVGSHADGEHLHAAEVKNIRHALGGAGVLTHSISLTVTEGDRNITVPAFNYLAPDGSGGLKTVVYAGGTLAVTAAASSPRMDSLTADKDGNVAMRDGVATAETGDVEEAPMRSLDDDEILIATVRSPASQSNVLAADIRGRAISVVARGGMAEGPLIPFHPGAVAESTKQMNSNTTMYVGLIEVTRPIIVSQIKFNVGSVGTGGTLGIAIFSNDGQTRYCDETTTSISGTGIHAHTMSANVYLAPGLYYVAFNPDGTADLTLTTFASPTAAAAAATGLNETGGTVTVTAGTVPTTFDPDTGVTYAANCCVEVRFN